MALPRYQQKPVQLQEGTSIAQRAQAQAIQSFGQRIDQFKGMAVEQVAKSSAKRAKEDAEKAFTERGMQAEVNQDISIYGDQYNRTLESLHKKRIAIDTSNNFKDLYETEKENPAKFQAMTEAYYEGSMKTIPDHMKAEFSIEYEANKAHYSGLVSKNAINKRKEEDRLLTQEIFNDAVNKTTQAMRDHNQTLALHEMTKGINALEDSYQNGNISLEERDKGIQKIYFDSSKANFKGVNDGYIERGDFNGAQEAIDTFRNTKIEGFSDKQRESLADEMQADLNRAGNMVKTSSATSQRVDNSKAKELIYLQENGQDVEIDRLEEALNSNISEPVREDLANAINDYNQMLLFNSKGLEDQIAMIDEIDKRKNKTKDDFRLQVKMSKAFERSRKDIEKDGLTYSLGKAFDEPIDPVDFTDSVSIDRRINQVNKASTFTGRQQPFFTKGELDSMKASLPTMTPSQKADLSSSINQLPENIKGATFSRLGGVFAVAGTHINPNVSTQIFSGEEILKNKMVKTSKDVRISINTNIKEALGVASNKNRADITNSIEAWMAYEADRTGVDIEDVSEDDAIEAVIGEKYVSGDFNPFVANKEVFAPYPGVSEDDFLEWKEGLTREDFGGTYETMRLKEADILKNGDFVYAGSGKYQIKVGDSIMMYEDDKGNLVPYVVEYPKP